MKGARPPLRSAVQDGLLAHGIAVQATDTPETLREKLNDVYLEEVRRLRARQHRGEIPLPEYATHVEALRRAFPLLGLPLDAWTDPLSP